VLGHLSFGVADLERSGRFYDAVMAALGQARVYDGRRSIGYGAPGTTRDKLLLMLKPEGAAPPGPGFHLAFDAASREAVDRFHAAGLAHGGTDNGAPGPRPNYSPTYYAAFVIDPDGHHLEAVCQ
jgi:catechol 2,3-dioxygenase-like lactoylglutathione lyase family enzyme